MLRLSQWRVRACYLGCLILVPFLKFVVRNEYGFMNAEALAAVLLLAGVCALLALAARGVAFHALTALCVTVLATYPAGQMLRPLSAVPPWLCATVIAALTWLVVRRMREKFFPVIAVFMLSGLALEMAAHTRLVGAAAAGHTGKAGEHVLWLILDEHIGLAGYPLDVPECVRARQALERTLNRFNFTLFPNAYSNYAMTVDSISSILNGRLVGQAEELMPKVGFGEMRHWAVRANRLSEEYAARGYRVEIWQYGAMRLCPEQAGRVECREYRDKLSWLRRTPGSWMHRFRWLVGSYQSTDPMLLRARGFFPFRFGVKFTGPLALEGLWPDGLAARIHSEPRQTLFLAHLLTPHSPYLLRRDGLIRPQEEWRDDRPDRRLGEQEYRETYCRYCEQAEFAARQLEEMLSRLERDGVLRGMTVVIHGDHGSRILRSLKPGDGTVPVSPDSLDFEGEPDGRDLMDRFSTLLAVKPAGAAVPSVDRERHSVLTFLSRAVLGREPADGADRADRIYLADSRQRFHAVDVPAFWR